MGFKIDLSKIPEEKCQTEKAWLMLYHMIESYKKNGMVLKASPTNLRFCQTAVNMADLLEKSPSLKGRG